MGSPLETFRAFLAENARLGCHGRCPSAECCVSLFSGPLRTGVLIGEGSFLLLYCIIQARLYQWQFVSPGIVAIAPARIAGNCDVAADLLVRVILALHQCLGSFVLFLERIPGFDGVVVGLGRLIYVSTGVGRTIEDGKLIADLLLLVFQRLTSPALGVIRYNSLDLTGLILLKLDGYLTPEDLEQKGCGNHQADNEGEEKSGGGVPECPFETVNAMHGLDHGPVHNQDEHTPQDS